ncbi:MAG TPA: molecular chaperone TorD family protein, partial [Thermoanaerobaculaceae bacterium]|nr:molecular chaperone TorD family protein [Thermoanaerobaculaceae bacterium]
MSCVSTPAIVAEVLDLLAEAWLEPGSDVRERAGVLGRRAAGVALEPLARALATLATSSAGELAVEYARVFLHGRPATAHPHESFYRTGLIGDPDVTAELGELLAAAGVDAGASRAVLPDHLGIELDLLALLV